MPDRVFDCFVVGGGINGCGIARDAAGRGYSVYLAEMGDLASGTSSAATKLIHGGLRYLEYYAFRLVREALFEREVLWVMAPHIIRPLRFVLPHHKGLRPAWFLRLGLFLYDHMGGRKHLPPTKTLDLRRDAAGAPLRPGFRRAFEFSDCRVDDSRLVVLNARDAADRGAVIATRTRVTGAGRENDIWRVSVQNLHTGEQSEIAARILVNAAGPWVDKVAASLSGSETPHRVRLVKGSHIVVKRLFDHMRCYFFQNEDGRILFALPYEDAFTLVGTTELDFDGDPADVAISAEEISYLVDAANSYFFKEVRREDIVWAFSGVRPLFDDGASKAQEATRDYVIELENRDGDPPLINIYGGMLTVYRRLAEQVLDRIDTALGHRTIAWTKGVHLPGGDFSVDGFDDKVARLQAAHAYLPPETARRLVSLYGTRAISMLEGAKTRRDLGEDFGAGLTEREVAYLMENEWAETVEDILWRRTKLGLKLNERDIAALERYLAAHESVAMREERR